RNPTHQERPFTGGNSSDSRAAPTRPADVRAPIGLRRGGHPHRFRDGAMRDARAGALDRRRRGGCGRMIDLRECLAARAELAESDYSLDAFEPEIVARIVR